MNIYFYDIYIFLRDGNGKGILIIDVHEEVIDLIEKKMVF